MSRGAHGDPFEILLVEDNPADVDLIREALLEAHGFEHRLSWVPDGEAALAFLRRTERYPDAPRPDLVLLDLNLPRKDGREVLAELRADPELTHLPVVVLTSSEAERDLMQSYRLHANSFVSKPVGLDQFFDVIRSLERFWLEVAKLPPRQEHELSEA